MVNKNGAYRFNFNKITSNEETRSSVSLLALQSSFVNSVVGSWFRASVSTSGVRTISLQAESDSSYEEKSEWTN